MTSDETLIIGSTNGIGLAISNELTKRKHKIFSISRSSMDEAHLSDLRQHYLADCTVFEDVTVVFKEMKRTGFSPTSIVCTVGSGGIRLNNRLNQWETNLSVNLLSVVNVVDAAIDWFSENLRNIVVISSISGVGAFLDPPLEYSVAKAALNHYIKIKSLELAQSGICLNAIAPGNILYPGSSWDKRLQLNSTSVEQFINANVPLKRFGTPEDIARVVCMIVEENSYMTGQILVCDGGQSL